MVDKIIGIRNYRGVNLVKVEADVDNMLELNVYTTTNRQLRESSMQDKFIKFNKIIWDVKVSMIFRELNETPEENVKAYIKESLEEWFGSCEERELPLERIDPSNIDITKFQGESLKYLEQLKFFDRMPIPVETKDFIEGYLDRLQEVELTRDNIKTIYTQYAEPISEVEEYTMYIGPNNKFKGAVGKIISTREDIAPFLVEFRGIKEDGSTSKFWAEEKNLVNFYA